MSQEENKAPTIEIRPEAKYKIKPYELVKINKSELTDKFSRKIGHLGKTLTHKSMCQAYNQALIDIQYLLMAAEKDLANE